LHNFDNSLHPTPSGVLALFLRCWPFIFAKRELVQRTDNLSDNSYILTRPWP